MLVPLAVVTQASSRPPIYSDASATPEAKFNGRARASIFYLLIPPPPRTPVITRIEPISRIDRYLHFEMTLSKKKRNKLFFLFFYTVSLKLSRSNNRSSKKCRASHIRCRWILFSVHFFFSNEPNERKTFLFLLLF